MRIALQTDRELDELGCADAVYIGERFCVKRFNRLFPMFVDYARRCSIPVHLLAPTYVREEELDSLSSSIEKEAAAFAGVHSADIGLCKQLNAFTQVTFVGPVYNASALEKLIQGAGIARLQLSPPRVHLIDKIAGCLPVETVVHGQLPLSSTPRCLVEMRLGDCVRCDEVFPVQGRPENLLLRGNILFPIKPIVGYGLIGQFETLGLETIVIECLHMDRSAIDDITAIYKGDKEAPNDEICGAFFTDEKDMLDGVPWRRRISRPDTLI